MESIEKMKILKKIINFIRLIYFNFLINCGKIDISKQYKPGNTCLESGKYLRLKDGQIESISDVDIDMEKDEQFPPSPSRGMTYVLLKKLRQ